MRHVGGNAIICTGERQSRRKISSSRATPGGGRAMNGQTKLIFPGLAGFYYAMLPVAGTLLRIVVGIMFLMHVSVKFKIGAAAVATNIMAKNGLEPALLFAYTVMFLETVGGICLVIGLFTRFFAAALAIEILIAFLFVHLSKGY